MDKTSSARVELNRFDVVCIGSALRDTAFFSPEFILIKNPKEDLLRQQLFAVEAGSKIRSNNVKIFYGGGAANTSANLAGLGLKTAIAATVGDDEDGEGVQHHLERQGVSCDLLNISKKRHTGSSFIAVQEESGERTAFIYYGANEEAPLSAAALHKVRTNWWYVSSLNFPEWSKFLTLVGNDVHGGKLVWNPGMTQLSVSGRTLKAHMKRTAVFIVNRDEALQCAMQLDLFSEAHGRKMTLEEIATVLQETGPEMVLVTDGRNGSAVSDGVRTYFHRAPKDHAVDTTGAGDCYASTFLAGLIRFDGDVPKAMELAQVNTSSLVHHIGAQNGLLKWKSMPARLKRAAKR